MKIYTRTGDTGQTSLFGGGRVPKDNRRVAAYGDVDELNAAIGMVRACEPVDLERELLESIQRDLFSLGALLASPDPDKVRRSLAKADLDATRIAVLEAAIDRLDGTLPPLTAFVLPGGSMKGAALHVARTVCRRAERSVVTVSASAEIPPLALGYLNRLSDLLFTLARYADHRSGAAEPTW